jgi:hypothetical protein
VTGRKPLQKTCSPSAPCSAVSSVASRLAPEKNPILCALENCAIKGWVETANESSEAASASIEDDSVSSFPA